MLTDESFVEFSAHFDSPKLFNKMHRSQDIFYWNYDFIISTGSNQQQLENISLLVASCALRSIKSQAFKKSFWRRITSTETSEDFRWMQSSAVVQESVSESLTDLNEIAFILRLAGFEESAVDIGSDQARPNVAVVRASPFTREDRREGAGMCVFLVQREHVVFRVQFLHDVQPEIFLSVKFKVE